jgi:hypothetical protein
MRLREVAGWLVAHALKLAWLLLAGYVAVAVVHFLRHLETL